MLIINNIKNIGIRFSVFIIVAIILLSYAPFGSLRAEAASVPSYSGNASVPVNNNVPMFDKSMLTTSSYEHYGALDNYGRCTVAEACIGIDIMPTQERGSIGMVKPTGWDQNKYPGIVDSEPAYLYNRCHMIGYQLSGENANERNLITGTRYFNIEGMLPYENQVASYVKSTGNHVMYRVTPVFYGSNLLCDGVTIEAYSVEDSGRGVCFNVYCYNVQPGIIIDYSNGSNHVDDAFTDAKIISDFSVNADGNAATIPNKGNVSDNQQGVTYSYVANKNTHKFHYSTCKSVQDMKEENKVFHDGSRDELIEQGYTPCKRCNP